jgi:hypothetical protein
VTVEKERVELTSEALMRKGENLNFQSKHNEAKAVYEELYNFMVEVYYPNHFHLGCQINKSVKLTAVNPKLITYVSTE